MPIYEYECRQCGYRLDALQKMSDPPLTDCPGCAQPDLRKLLSAPHFRLKGSGWYETDFKNSGRGKRDEDARDGESGSSAKNGKQDATSTAQPSGGDAPGKGRESGASADSG